MRVFSARRENRHDEPSRRAKPAPAFDPDALIIKAPDNAELTQKWCAANPQVEHVLVLPAALIVDNEQLICEGPPYKL